MQVARIKHKLLRLSATTQGIVHCRALGPTMWTRSVTPNGFGTSSTRTTPHIFSRTGTGFHGSSPKCLRCASGRVVPEERDASCSMRTA